MQGERAAINVNLLDVEEEVEQQGGALIDAQEGGGAGNDFVLYERIGVAQPAALEVVVQEGAVLLEYGAEIAAQLVGVAGGEAEVGEGEVGEVGHG